MMPYPYRQLELSKSSKTCEVRLMLTAENYTTTSPELKFPITQDIGFIIQVENATQHEGNDSIKICLKYKVNVSYCEEQTIWTKFHIYNVSGETEKRLLCGNRGFYTSTEVKAKTQEFSSLHSTILLKSTITVDNEIDLLAVFEETYAVKHLSLEKNSTRVQSGLGNAFEDAHFKDIKFVIGDESLMAHKVICAAKSKVFHVMFTSDTRERQEGVVEILDTRMIAFEAFIKFFYTAKIDNMEEYAEELLILADKYDVQDLKVKCENYLSEHLNKENAIDLLIQAEKYNCQVLKKNALEVVKFSLKECRNFNLLYTIPSLVEKVFDLIDEEEKERSNKRKKLSKSSKLSKYNLSLSNFLAQDVLRPPNIRPSCSNCGVNHYSNPTS